MSSILKIFKLEVLRVTSIHGMTKNGELKVLFSDIHRRTNIVALLNSNLLTRNKTAYSELWYLGTSHTNFD
jgi:hypothetical protein